MSYLYWKWDKAIPKEYCELIIKNIDWNKKETALITGKGLELKSCNKKRKTDIVWEKEMSVVGCIANSYIKTANLSAGWNYNLTNTEEIQLGKYYNGGFYGWHNDSNIISENPRKLSFTLLLNDSSEFKGGKLEFKNEKEQPTLEQGTIIVFPSFIEHRVTPVTSGERYSAVTWMHGPNFK